MSKQKGKIEWSFDFESMGERFSQFFSDVAGEEVEVKSAELLAPLDGARSAKVDIDFAVGKASLSALPIDSDNLFEARINYIGEYEFEDSGGPDRVISLRQKGPLPRGVGRFMGKQKDLIWDLALAPKVPCQLRMKGGIGETDIDLSNLLVDAVKLESGVGKIALLLPAQAGDFAARIDGGVGKTDVLVPAGGGGTLDINGGAGEVTVSVEAGAALRLMADAGIGKVNLPDSLLRVKGGEHFIGISGIWESPGFAEADKRIVIDFDGGVGSFTLKHFDML